MGKYEVTILDADGAEHRIPVPDDWMENMESRVAYEAWERQIRFVRIVEIEYLEDES